MKEWYMNSYDNWKTTDANDEEIEMHEVHDEKFKEIVDELLATGDYSKATQEDRSKLFTAAEEELNAYLEEIRIQWLEDRFC